MIKIPVDDLVDMADYTDDYPLLIDVVYARPDHPENVFGTALYKPEASLWLHKDLAEVVLLAAKTCFEETGYVFELKDGLRPVEAQQAMRETEVVKANPLWLEAENPLLSKPGQGGHPRGMAIDIVLRDKDGVLVDMGTPFDYFAPDPDKENPAARDYMDFSDEVLANRKLLETYMVRAGQQLNRKINPLSSEWWDFRFERDYINRFAPFSDADLKYSICKT